MKHLIKGICLFVMCCIIIGSIPVFAEGSTVNNNQANVIILNKIIQGNSPDFSNAVKGGLLKSEEENDLSDFTIVNNINKEANLLTTDTLFVGFDDYTCVDNGNTIFISGVAHFDLNKGNYSMYYFKMTVSKIDKKTKYSFDERYRKSDISNVTDNNSAKNTVVITDRKIAANVSDISEVVREGLEKSLDEHILTKKDVIKNIATEVQKVFNNPYGIRISNYCCSNDGERLIITGEADIKDEEDNVSSYYFKMTVLLTDGKDEQKYKFDGSYQPRETFNIAKGWAASGNKIYYFGYENGEMAKGWQEINNKWYYFENDGEMKTGWIFIEGKWYYFNNVGVMQTGLVKDSTGKSYRLSSTGALI